MVRGAACLTLQDAVCNRRSSLLPNGFAVAPQSAPVYHHSCADPDTDTDTGVRDAWRMSKGISQSFIGMVTDFHL